MRAFSEPYLGFLFRATAHLAGGPLTQIKTRPEGMGGFSEIEHEDDY